MCFCCTSWTPFDFTDAFHNAEILLSHLVTLGATLAPAQQGVSPGAAVTPQQSAETILRSEIAREGSAKISYEPVHTSNNNFKIMEFVISQSFTKLFNYNSFFLTINVEKCNSKTTLLNIY